MAGANGSSADAFLYQFVNKSELDSGTIMKLVVVILMTLFFVSVNCIMLCALRSKRVFKESPRYILFAHMLFNDSVQLILTSLLYVFILAYLKITKVFCSLLIFLSVTIFRNAPFNLAVMSLERYVAICFPLRHAVIATPSDGA